MAVLKRRRFPRRRYMQKIGILYKGKYHLGSGLEIGEGGLKLYSDHEFENGGKAVLSFLISAEVYIVVIAEVRYHLGPKNGDPESFGFQFVDIAFDKKRAIRDYIAAKTEVEAEEELKLVES